MVASCARLRLRGLQYTILRAMSEYSAFANLLNQYLTDVDQSAAWLAKRLKINPSTTARWCNGETRPGSPELVGRLADVLGVYDTARRSALQKAAGYAYLELATRSYSDQPADDTTTSDRGGDASPIVKWVDPVLVSQQGMGSTAPTKTKIAPGSQQDANKWFRPITLLFAQPLVQVGSIIILLFLLLLSVIRNRVNSLPMVAVQYFAIDEWKNLSPGASDQELLFTEGTRRVLYDKLGLVPTLQGVASNSPQVTEKMRSGLNIWIEGQYQQINGIQLTATIFGRDGVHMATVSVHSEQPINGQEANICSLDLQDQLAQRILAALQITVTQQLATTMAQTPTHSCEALHLNNQAVDLVMSGGFQSAQILLERALTLDPKYADAYNNLGQLFARQGDWANAERRYQQAIVLQPANAVFHYNLGLAHEHQGDYPAALLAYQQAIDLDPLYVQALNNMGFTYLLQKNLTEALAILRRGLELAPDAYYLHKNLGRVYLEQGDTGQAVHELQEAIKLFGSTSYAEGLYYLALAYQRQGQSQPGCAALKQYRLVADKDEAQRREQAKELEEELRCATK